MPETKDYACRVWEGDERTVAEARERYEADREGGLLPYAVALYSFRRNKRYAAELVSLMYELIGLSEREVMSDSPKDTALYSRLAERADVLSTHLEWISRQPGVGDYPESRAHWVAVKLCNHGLYFASAGNAPKVGHTIPLLHLTFARLWLNRGETQSAVNHLRWAAESSKRVQDKNQRARVYRKLGMLYRKCGKYSRGLLFGVRAVTMRGITLSVRAKSVAALLGVGD